MFFHMHLRLYSAVRFIFSESYNPKVIKLKLEEKEIYDIFSKRRCRIDKSPMFHASDVPSRQSFLTLNVIRYLINPIR